MKYLLVGFLLSLMATLTCLIVWGMEKAILVTGGIGTFFFVLSMISLGTLVSGDRMRANFASESITERHRRTSMSTMFILIGLPNFIVAGCFLYFFVK